MKKLFLFTVLLSFASVVSGCSNDTPDCGCNATKDQEVEGTGLLYKDSSAETEYYIYVGNPSLGTSLLICNASFLNTLNSLPNEQESVSVIFKAISTKHCFQEGIGPGNYSTAYINLTQIEEE